MGIFSFVRPPRKYEHYVDRASFYELLSLRNKAIETMKEAVKQPFAKKEIASGLIYLGMMHEKKNEMSEASDYYHQALEVTAEEEFKYHKHFKQMIEAFIKNGDEQRAQIWLDNLLVRQTYDKRFAKLSALKKHYR
ncbi:hypothetical protein FE782_14280 [Paenibacillus antri]|uniref:Uncharacterized protein n=1 Tax=Paenibacillus antri TaxID=2582848 RepID=A0A5R9GEM7_9BACL|nr:hypothetical protein [Paenibacillus antri]TLS51664.1 hypothetical protein FE782_14280 [Paenibacillus antri]